MTIISPILPLVVVPVLLACNQGDEHSNPQTSTAGRTSTSSSVENPAAQTGGIPVSATSSESPVDTAGGTNSFAEGGTSALTSTSNGGISSADSGASNPLAFYDIVETFTEPECMQDTVFTGTFTFDTVERTVSNLRGTLTECMFDGPPSISLVHQLSATSASLGGVDGTLVATFALATTATFADGSWAPGGTRTSGNANAYTLVFVPTKDPTCILTADQIDWLAYADCSANGLMGTACMTGTTVAAYGRLGTMKGYPSAQVITER